MWSCQKETVDNESLRRLGVNLEMEESDAGDPVESVITQRACAASR